MLTAFSCAHPSPAVETAERAQVVRELRSGDVVCDMTTGEPWFTVTRRAEPAHTWLLEVRTRTTDGERGTHVMVPDKYIAVLRRT